MKPQKPHWDDLPKDVCDALQARTGRLAGRLRRTLADHLMHIGWLTDPAWRETVEAVPPGTLPRGGRRPNHRAQRPLRGDP